jgi:hypothetical protein
MLLSKYGHAPNADLSNRITQQAIRRGTFRSVKELVEKIDQ